MQESAREDEGFFIRSGIVVVLRNQTIKCVPFRAPVFLPFFHALCCVSHRVGSALFLQLVSLCVLVLLQLVPRRPSS